MKCRKWMAITLAAMMAMGTMTMAFAEDEPENGNTTSDSVSYSDNQTHEIAGDVVSNTDTAVTVSGNDTSVSISGSVTNEHGHGIDASDSGTVIVDKDVNVSGTDSANGDPAMAVKADTESTVTVHGNITVGNPGDTAVTVSSGSTVTVDGNVTSSSYGMYADRGTNVTVGGDITSESTAVNSSTNSTVTVNGNVSSENNNALLVRDSNVTVGGNATSSTNDAVRIIADINSVEGPATSGDAKTTVIVKGDITSGEGKKDLTVEATLNEGTELSDLVDIAVGSLDPEKVSATGNNNTDLTDTLLASIRYIVSVDEESAAVKYTGTTEFEGYDTARAGETFTVSANQKGYKIDSLTTAGEYAEVTRNKNGTWTVKVADGGGLVLCATLVKNSDGTVTVVETTTTKAKTTTAPKYAKGSKVYINGGAWIITDIDDEGIWTLRSLKAFKEAELTDREAVLESMLTEAQLADVLATEAGEYVQEIDSDGHIIIRCENGIMNAKL